VRAPLHIAASLVATFGSGCLKSWATGAAADALSGAGGGGVYAQDDDPELVAAAIPFGLKTMEALLVEQPKHTGLLTGLASGFVQYGVAFVDMPADRVETEDLALSQEMKLRARKLFLRARGYALRGLEVDQPGFSDQVRKDLDGALAKMKKEHVPLLYWTAASWGLAISASKTDASMIADLPIVEHIAERAIALDRDWNDGALHELFIKLETSRAGGSVKKAREHFDAAIALSKGRRAGPYVSLAEAVTVKEQNVREFNALLDKALAVDVEASPNDRLANVIMQRRARWLKSRVEDLFLDANPEGTETSTASM
jgi:predicted anti-sigma-YlaC factor YlaD